MATQTKRWRRPPLYVLLGLVFSALASAAIAGGAIAFDRWVTRSPAFCESCHVVAPEVAIWARGEHRTIACQACHHQTLDDGLRILRVYLLGGNPDAGHGAPSSHSCFGCHSQHDERWPKLSAAPGHRVHVVEEKLACTKCHGRQMHFNPPTDPLCLECHTSLSGSCERTHCTECHSFGALDRKLRP